MKDLENSVDKYIKEHTKITEVKSGKIYTGTYFVIFCNTLRGRKTPIYHIRSINDLGVGLGDVKWFGAWRKFCFFPCDKTVWDTKCLNEVVEFVDKINNEYNCVKESL